MMDESAKEQFKWRFWHVAVILNGVILFFAIAIISLILVPLPFRYPVAGISLILAVILSVIFRRQYLATKAWLDKNA